jgi:hypothetical protein
MQLRPHHLLPRLARPGLLDHTLRLLPSQDLRTLARTRERTLERLPARSIRTHNARGPHHPHPRPHPPPGQVAMATHNAGRSSATYRAWVKQVLARCEPVCIRCGYPVDMALPRTDPQGASADHEPPLADTGDLTPGLDGAGIAHLSCNRSHGGRLGSARATAKRSTTKSSNTRSNAIDRSLSKARTTDRKSVV